MELFHPSDFLSFFRSFSLSLHGSEKHPRFFTRTKSSKLCVCSDCELSSLGQPGRRTDLPLLFWERVDCVTHALMYLPGLCASQLASRSASCRWLKWTGHRDVYSARRGWFRCADFPSSRCSSLCPSFSLPSFSFQLGVTCLSARTQTQAPSWPCAMAPPPCTPTHPASAVHPLSLLTVHFDLLSGKLLQCGDRTLPSSCTNESEDGRE